MKSGGWGGGGGGGELLKYLDMWYMWLMLYVGSSPM